MPVCKIATQWNTAGRDCRSCKGDISCCLRWNGTSDTKVNRGIRERKPAVWCHTMTSGAVHPNWLGHPGYNVQLEVRKKEAETFKPLLAQCCSVRINDMLASRCSKNLHRPGFGIVCQHCSLSDFQCSKFCIVLVISHSS